MYINGDDPQARKLAQFSGSAASRRRFDMSCRRIIALTRLFTAGINECWARGEFKCSPHVKA